MTTNENKTVPSNADVENFIAHVESDTRRADVHQLLALFERVTGDPAQMWGPSIIGFGSYHYTYASGREGDMCRTGFSPRKANLSLYFMCGYEDPTTEGEMAAMRERLGKHKTGKSCLYINRLNQVDLGVLEGMIRINAAYMDASYPR